MQCPVTLDIAEDTDAALDLPTPSPVSSLRQALSPVSLIPNTMQPRLNCVSIPSNLTSDRVGSIVTVKHIEVQLANLPTYFGVNEDQQIKEFGQLGGGWICVYVPEGTSLISHSLTGVLVSLLILCMNLIRMCWVQVLG